MFARLGEYNADFEALQELEEQADAFSVAEIDELRALLGLYGFEREKRLRSRWASDDYLEERQQVWREVAMLSRHPSRCAVAQRAVARYGLLLEEAPDDSASPSG